MGVKALLVYPELPPTYWSMKYALPFLGRKAVMPPLGLLTVASLLPPDWDVTLVDMNVERLSAGAVSAADVVLTSSMLIQKESLARVIRLCKELGKTVVAGGPYPTSCHEYIPGVDHFVLNEAETTLPAFLDDFARGRAARIYSDEGRPDIGRTPAPRFDLLRRKTYSTMAVQYSRGCPHSCEFCDIIELFGQRPRTKSPDQFLGELDRLYERGWRGSLFVVDDNFIGNVKEVRKLLPAVASWQEERNYPFNLFTEATLGLASDDALMDQMVRAGFNMVFLGIETPDRCTLESAGKRQNLKSDMLSSVRRIQEKGMEVSAGFILGFDTDPDDIFDRQIRFIQDAGIPTAMVSLLTALPKTKLHQRLLNEGRLREGTTAGNNTHDLRLSFVPRMEAGKLLDGYRRVLSELYEPRRYFDRCLDLLRSLKVHRTSNRRIRLTELRAFLHSMIRQTFSRYSLSYWRFLVRGALAKPRMLAETVTMAVKGHHFFKMTRNILEVDRIQRNLESFARAIEERARIASGVDVRERLAELKAYRDRVIARKNARLRRLDADFRVHAEEAVARFKATTDDLLARIVAE
ncbi:MAG: B12-binding domain-containing radical SAM protein [Acidithiobacillales bacterium]